MEEASVAQALSRLFSGGGDVLKECVRASTVANCRYKGQPHLGGVVFITCLKILVLLALKGL